MTALQLKLAASALVCLAIPLLTRRLRERLMEGAADVTGRHKVRQATSAASWSLWALSLVLIWAPDLRSLGVFFGILGAGLTLSIQESLLCLVGWGVIVVRRLYDLGDRITMGGVTGDVLDIHVFHTTLLEVAPQEKGEQSTGCLVAVPNSQALRSTVMNFNRGFPFLWNELTMVVTFESDWREAKGVLLELATRESAKLEDEVRRHLDHAQDRLPIVYRNLTPTVYTVVADHGVALTLRHLCPVRRRRGAIHELSEAFLDWVLEAEGVDLAYPTTRFFRASEAA